MADTDQTGTITIDTDGDSSYGGSDGASETTSLRSAVFNYVYENGRRYHSYRAGAYWCVHFLSLGYAHLAYYIYVNES